MSKSKERIAPSLVKFAVPMERVAPDPANARLHPQANLDAIRGSLLAFGQQKPIVVDDRGVIVAGNGLYLAARSLGWKRIAAVKTRLRGADRTGFAIADNRTAELAEWDEEALARQLKELGEELDIEALGFDAEDLARLLNPDVKEGLTDPDAVPEPPKKAMSKRGEVYLLGKHRLMCGDALDQADRALLADGEHCGCCITSPPYNVGIKYSGYRDRQAKDAYLDFIRRAADGAFELLADGRFCAWNMGVSPQTFHAHQIVTLEAAGFEFYRQIVWYKAGVAYPIFPSSVKARRIRHYHPNYVHEVIAIMEKGENERPPTETCPVCEGEGNVQVLMSCTGVHEIVVLFTKGEPEPGDEHRPSRAHPNDVWKIAQSAATTDLKTLGIKSTTLKKAGKSSHMIKEHPAAYPAELPRALMGYLMNQAETVYDPFLGSGTTLIAAEQLGRRCYGMEIEPRYVDVAIRRWEEFTGKKAARPGTAKPKKHPGKGRPSARKRQVLAKPKNRPGRTRPGARKASATT